MKPCRSPYLRHAAAAFFALALAGLAAPLAAQEPAPQPPPASAEGAPSALVAIPPVGDGAAMVDNVKLSDNPLSTVLDMLERSSPAQFAAQIQALLQRPDAAPLLECIACPTPVLTGREDLWSPPAQHAAIARAVAGAQLCIVEHCGHMSTMEQPQAVSAALSAWLAAGPA